MFECKIQYSTLSIVYEKKGEGDGEFLYLEEEWLEKVCCVDDDEDEDGGEVGGQQLAHDSSLHDNNHDQP